MAVFRTLQEFEALQGEDSLTAPERELIANCRAGRATVPNGAARDAESGPGRDYESFNRYAYAADVVIPIIDLGQGAAWAPSSTRGPAGRYAWWPRWVFKAAGWLVSALGAAAVTGIIRRE